MNKTPFEHLNKETQKFGNRTQKSLKWKKNRTKKITVFQNTEILNPYSIQPPYLIASNKRDLYMIAGFSSYTQLWSQKKILLTSKIHSKKKILK